MHQVTYIPKFFSFLIRGVHLLYRMISSHRNTIHTFICSFKNNIYDEKSARAHHSISSWVATICPSEKMCVKANSYNKNAGFESGKKGDKIYFHIKHQTSSNTKKQNSTIILFLLTFRSKNGKGKKNWLIDRWMNEWVSEHDEELVFFSFRFDSIRFVAMFNNLKKAERY